MKHSSRLSSTALSSCEWDDETSELTVQFANGSTYDFPGVPQEVYEGLVSASSPGSFFNTFIKNQY